MQKAIFVHIGASRENHLESTAIGAIPALEKIRRRFELAAFSVVKLAPFSVNVGLSVQVER
jgi:hypothetical protein